MEFRLHKIFWGSSDTVQQTPSFGETVQTSLGDREDGTGEDRADNERADEAKRSDREDESGKSNEMGCPDEQHSESGRRNCFERTN